MPEEKQLKKVNYRLIEVGSEPYDVLSEAVCWHCELSEANIALAWRIETPEDKDGHIVLGRCVKITDLQKEFAEYDFIIVLNQEYWGEFNHAQKLALVDHELHHAARATDADDLPKQDERGRPVWRVRKHDIEEFHAVVERHGCWKKDLLRFAEAIREKRKAPLLNQESLLSKVMEKTAEEINSGALDTPNVKVTATVRQQSRSSKIQ